MGSSIVDDAPGGAAQSTRIISFKKRSSRNDNIICSGSPPRGLLLLIDWHQTERLLLRSNSYFQVTTFEEIHKNPIAHDYTDRNSTLIHATPSVRVARGSAHTHPHVKLTGTVIQISPRVQRTKSQSHGAYAGANGEFSCQTVDNGRIRSNSRECNQSPILHQPDKHDPFLLAA